MAWRPGPIDLGVASEMNQDASVWDTSRWRNSSNVASPMASSHNALTGSLAPHYPNRPPAPLLSALTSTAPQSSILAQRQNHDAWIRKSAEGASLPRLTEPSVITAIETSNLQTRLYEGHRSPELGPPRQPLDPSELRAGEPSSSRTTWRLHHGDRRSSSPDAPPLTLHSPRPEDLPRLSSTAKHFHDLPGNPPSTYQFSSSSTSLPSFASLRDCTAWPDDVDGPDIASMSSQLSSCYLCTKLKPLVQDVTSAISDLDDTVQSYCGSSSSIGKGISAPNDGDSPIRAIQWILERLHYARHDLQQAARRNRESYQHQPHQSQVLGASPQQTSPRNPLKRPAEPWDKDDFHGLKRPRSGASSVQPFQLPALTTRETRRESSDYSNRDLGPGASPAPSESVPGSAHPRQTSPTRISRLNTRALPSPSSLAYPLSAAPSLPPVTGQNIASPATSYQQAPSVNTASTNSATSAHIADLQHQITLKSLALQSLQTEYASLLQKLQRERVKSQAIEKKTNVSDQEVNDLTTKNDELTEQVKSLEAQLEECESKREAARVEASKEKDQWGRMLEMGGRLQAKIDGERQKLLEEKAALQQRLIHLEGLKSNQQADGLDSTATGQTVTPNSSKGDQYKPTSTIYAESTAQVNTWIKYNEAAGLRHQVASLNRRIDTLRLALEGAKRQNAELGQQAHGLLERSTNFSNTIEQAIKEDDAQAEQADLSPQRKTSTCSTPARMQMQWDPPEPPHMPSATSLSPQTFRSKSGSRTSTLEVYSDGKVKTAIVADVARAASPGPEELGIHVTPSTSTPEELIRALGPVPAPIPSLQSQARGDYWGFPSVGQSGSGARESGNIPRLPPVRASQTDHDTSPRSYHSSPGELVEDRLSNASSANRSPEAFVSDPEGKSSGTRSKSKQTFGRFLPIHLETTRTQEAGTYQYHGSHYTWVPAMPPPPRPAPASSFTP